MHYKSVFLLRKRKTARSTHWRALLQRQEWPMPVSYQQLIGSEAKPLLQPFAQDIVEF